jgi:hypothetical protein
MTAALLLCLEVLSAPRVGTPMWPVRMKLPHMIKREGGPLSLQQAATHPLQFINLAHLRCFLADRWET